MAEAENKNSYFQMYADVWTYHQKYINSLQDDNEFWHKLVEDGKAISKKYNNNRFICNLVTNEMAEFETMYKTESEKNAQVKYYT